MISNNHTISIGNKVYHNQMSTSTLNDVISVIKTDSSIRDKVKITRSIEDKKQRRNYKKYNLPYFNLGLFRDNIRRGENLTSTQYMIIDVDDLSDEQIDAVKNKLINDKKIFIYFVSPSGNGYKVVYKFSDEITDYEKYTENYVYYANKLWGDYIEEIDSQTKDSCRACFFSYDPDLYLNENAETLEVKEFVETVNTLDFTTVNTDDDSFIPEAVEHLRTRISSYDDWTRAGMALASHGELGRSHFQNLSSNPQYNDSPAEVDKKYDNFLQTATGKIQIATLFEIAKSHGFEYTTPVQPTKTLDANKFVQDMKAQFALDDTRVIGELIGYELNTYFEIASNLDGVQPGFYHLAADTNIGKTAVYTNLAIDMIKSNDDVQVLFFALDDSKKYAAYRFLSILSELRFRDVKYGVNNLNDPIEHDALKDAREDFLGYIEDEKLLVYDIADIQHINQLENVIKQYSTKKLVVIIDGLYNLEVSDNSKGGIREENIERAQKVKKLVDVYDIPVFTTGEFRKKMKTEGVNKKPTIDDLMETGKFAYNANVVWLLYPEDQNKKNEPEVNLVLEYAKNKVSEFKGIQQLTFVRAKGQIIQGWSAFGLASENDVEEEV